MTTTFYGTLNHIECANCGITFGITPDYEKRRRDDHKGFLCPNGHSNVYNGSSEEEKLRRERDNLKQQMARVEDEKAAALREAEHARASARTHKGHLTRTKNRIAAGVCPCCNRTFDNLARHMATQHKDYKKQEAA